MAAKKRAAAAKPLKAPKAYDTRVKKNRKLTRQDVKKAAERCRDRLPARVGQQGLQTITSNLEPSAVLLEEDCFSSKRVQPIRIEHKRQFSFAHNGANEVARLWMLP